MVSSLSRILLLPAITAAFSQPSASQICHQAPHVVGAPFTAKSETTYKDGGSPSSTEQIARDSNGSLYCATYNRDGNLVRVEIEDVPNNRQISFNAPLNSNDHNRTYRQSTPERGFSTESLEEERLALRKRYQCWTDEPDHQRADHLAHYIPLGERPGDGMTLFGLRVETTNADGKKQANESWQSDIGLMMSYTYMDPGRGKYIHSVVTNLRREEPDASLFLVPKEYLSDPLLDANTIFIVNQTGSPEILNAATAYLALWKDKKPLVKPLTIVAERNAADLTATLAKVPLNDQGSTTSGVQLQIYLRESTNPVFEVTERSSGSEAADKFAARQCVLDLFNRVVNTHVGQWPPAAHAETKTPASE
jgi:hypothetical protein